MELNRLIDQNNQKNPKVFDHLALNNKIIKNYGAKHIVLSPKCVKIKNEKKFLGFFYYNDILLLIGTYMIIGTFSPEHNVWVWADQSLTLDRTMIGEVSDLRRQLIDSNPSDETFKEFVKSDHTVLSTSDVCNNIITLGDMVVESDVEKNKYNILTLDYKKKICVLFIKKILTNNTMEYEN
jgi:hypothetical protein